MSAFESRASREAAQKIKRVARRLFAERGVDGVTVREIAEAAGQKNHGAVSYYFVTKDALVRELVADGARIIDARRNTLLDEMEAGDRLSSLRAVAEILVYPSVNLESDGAEESYSRFIVMLQMTHRELFIDALENRWNSGYQRGLEHLRRLMPPMSSQAKNQRFLFMAGLLGAALASREQALDDPSRGHPMWGSDDALVHLVDAICAILQAPSAAPTPSSSD